MKKIIGLLFSILLLVVPEYHAQGLAQMPKGIFTMTGPASEAGQGTPAVLLTPARNDIDGVSTGDRWKTIENPEGTFIYTKIDGEIKRVTTNATHPKQILIRNASSGGLPVSTPQWVIDACYTDGTSTFTGATYTSGSRVITGATWSTGYAALATPNPGEFKSCDYGKKVTGSGIPSGNQTFADGSFVLNSTAISSPTALFTVGDVGKTITSTGVIPSSTTIAAVNSATNCILSNPVSAGGTQSFTIVARDTTIMTINSPTSITVNREPTSFGGSKTFQVVGRNFIIHDDHVQGSVADVQVTQPVLWDATYVAKKVAFITATGAHFTSGNTLTSTEKAAIKVVAAAYANTNTEDHSMLTDTSSNPPFPDSELNRTIAHGYTTAKMIQAGKDIVGATLDAYPNALVTVALGANGSLDNTAANADPLENPPNQTSPDATNYVDRKIKDYFRNLYPNRYIIQKNNLAEKNANPPYTRGNAFYMIWGEGNGYSAEQMLWNHYSSNGSGPESSCRNASDATMQATWTDGQFSSSNTIISNTAKFAALDIGKVITAPSGIPAGATIASVVGLNSTTFTSNTITITGSPTTNTSNNNTFTIGTATCVWGTAGCSLAAGDRTCDPKKVLNGSLLSAVAKGDSYVEVYQPDTVNGEGPVRIAHNTLTASNGTVDLSFLKIIFVR